MILKDFKIGDIVWIKTPWLCNEFGNTYSIIKIEEISDDVCKYSFPIIEHFVRHYTGPETDTFEIDANTEATPQFTQDGFEKEMHKEYDKSQCVYGKNSTMLCMFCSATCQARYKDFTEKGVKIVSIPVKSGVPDSNGRTYSKEALENAVKEYNAKHNDNKLEIKHDGTVEFIVATNEAFENGVNNEILNEIYKHDSEDNSHLINPYLINTESLLKTVTKERNLGKYSIYIKGGGWYTGMENQRLPAQLIGVSDGVDFIDAVQRWAKNNPGFEYKYGELTIKNNKAFLWGYEVVATEEEATENGKYELVKNEEI